MKKTKSSSKSKFTNNWLTKSLENLEKDSWGELPKNESNLVVSIHKLRKKQLKDFDIEDLRFMIGQNIGLYFLIPLAMEVLKENILAEGDYYEGDLLKMVLTSKPEYWQTEIDNWYEMSKIVGSNITELRNDAAEFATSREILKAYKEFERIN